MKKETVQKKAKPARKAKAPKTVKPAGMFKKPIKAKTFGKRFELMIGQPADQQFLRSCFAEKDGAYALRADLDAATTKRLNKLAKTIKGNRGVFKAAPLIGATLLVAGLAVFGLFFMDPILEDAVEAGLQAAFGAKAEVTGLRFSPFEMRFSIASIAVADKQAPMTNLFETGRLELRLNASAALRGKIYIEEASAESIAVGTARKVSGALPEASVPEKVAVEEAPAAPPMVDFANFDANALLEREKSMLASVAAYEEAGKAYEEASARWTGRVESSTKAVADLQTSTKALLATDTAKLSKPDEIAKAITEAKKAIEATKTVTTEAKAITADIQKDADSVAKLEKAAIASVDKDLGYLQDLIDPSSGAALSALEPSIREVISDQLETYIYYGLRAWGFLREFRASAPKKEAPAPAPSYKGRTVYFPSVAYPGFRLGLLKTSFTVDGVEWAVEFREISTDPELVSLPTGFLMTVRAGTMAYKADATIDLREKGGASYAVELDASGIPVDLGDALAEIGIAGVTGTLSASGSMGGSENGYFKLVIDGTLDGVKTGGGEGVIGKAIVRGIEKEKRVAVGVSSLTEPGKDNAFAITTNLDAIIASALSALAEEYMDMAMAEVEKAVNEYVATELEGELLAKGDFQTALSAAKGDDAAVAALNKKLDVKLKELEAKAKAIGGGILGGISIPGITP